MPRKWATHQQNKPHKNGDEAFSGMASLCTPMSGTLSPQPHFDRIFPYFTCKQVLLHCFGLWPTLSGRVITTKADALAVNAQTLRQPDTSLSKHIIIKQRCGWEENSDQKDTPKVTTLCSNFNTSSDPAAEPLWF